MKAILLYVITLVFAAAGMSQDRGYETKVIKLPAGFLEGHRSLAHDQFFTIEDFLKKQIGVEFPEGTAARTGFKGENLQVIHSPQIIERIESFIENAASPLPKILQLQCEIFEVDVLTALKVQEATSGENDHSAARDQILKAVTAGKGRAVYASSLFAKSGQRGKISDAAELQYATEFDWDESGDVSIPVAFETRNVGTTLEVDPIIGADQHTIDVNFSLEHHTAPPVMRRVEVRSAKGQGQVYGEMPEFHSKRIITQITMIKGQTLLIGAWKPTGRPDHMSDDVMRIVFLRADVVAAKSE